MFKKKEKIDLHQEALNRGNRATLINLRLENYGSVQYQTEGSLRDYAIIHFMASQIHYEGMEGNDPKDRAIWANEYADAMIAERNKNGA